VNEQSFPFFFGLVIHRKSLIFCPWKSPKFDGYSHWKKRKILKKTKTFESKNHHFEFETSCQEIDERFERERNKEQTETDYITW